MTTILIFLGGSWAFWAGSFYPSNTLDRTLAGDAKFLVRDLIVLPKIYQQLFTDCHTLQQSLLTVWELIDSDYARIRTEYYHNFTYGPLVMINVNFHNFFSHRKFDRRSFVWSQQPLSQSDRNLPAPD